MPAALVPCHSLWDMLAAGVCNVQCTKHCVRICAYAGQEFAKVGLQNCNINSSLPVGSVIRIPFLVWDNGLPPLSATVNRTLVITAPCRTGAVLYMRQALPMSWSCNALSHVMCTVSNSKYGESPGLGGCVHGCIMMQADRNHIRSVVTYVVRLCVSAIAHVQAHPSPDSSSGRSSFFNAAPAMQEDMSCRHQSHGCC